MHSLKITSDILNAHTLQGVQEKISKIKIKKKTTKNVFLV